VTSTLPPRRSGPHGRLATLLVALAVCCSGCLSADVPPPPATLPATLGPTAAPRAADQLVIAVPADPSGFLPPAADVTTALLIDLLDDPLYRLDPALRPQPALAAALPDVSSDGLDWTITLRDGRFSDGAALTAADAATSLDIAASPDCPYGTDICSAAAAGLAQATATDRTTLTLHLKQPDGPFLAEVLARVPILTDGALFSGTQSLLASAGAIDPTEPGRQVQQIADATNQDACLDDPPPFGCRLSDYAPTLEGLLTSAGLALPSQAVFTGANGTLDAEAYAAALLERVAALDQVLTQTGTDQIAAALPLLDPLLHPLGAGPYQPVQYVPGESLSLAANDQHAGGAAAIPNVLLEIVPDPSVAATQLATGEVDWDLDVGADQLPTLEGVAGIAVGARPLATQRTIVFNVRPGRLYAGDAERQAFSLCLDRQALANAASGGSAILAETPTAAGSWAMDQPPEPERNVNQAVSLLMGDGWQRGADGIFARGEQRLSSSIAVRPSRPDLLAFANGAALQLADCGIELQVQQLDLTGDLLLTQLQWPNDFDTVLLSRSLGVDPDADVQAFEGSHATSAENPADANPGGYDSVDADQLIATARAAVDADQRRTAYAQLESLLTRDVPAWPIWYDAGWSALSDRLTRAARSIDVSQPHFWWDLDGWSLAPVGRGPGVP
jgi:ABC-type transport system substrate-binding protein